MNITNRRASILKIRSIRKQRPIWTRQRRFCSILRGVEKQSNDHWSPPFSTIRPAYCKGPVTLSNLPIIWRPLSSISMILLKASLKTHWIPPSLTVILKNMLISPFTWRGSFPWHYITLGFVHLLLTPKITSLP